MNPWLYVLAGVVGLGGVLLLARPKKRLEKDTIPVICPNGYYLAGSNICQPLGPPLQPANGKGYTLF